MNPGKFVSSQKKLHTEIVPAYAPCPVCHDGVLTERYAAPPLDYCTAHTFPIAICSACGYGLTVNVPSTSAALYVGGCDDVAEKPWRRLLQPLLDWLERRKLGYLRTGHGTRLLEIGCGKGGFLTLAQACGYQVYGIEPSLLRHAFAARRLGNAVASINFEGMQQIATFPREYDYVMLWHVLEHLHEPFAVLAQLRQLLAERGRLVVAVPNFASFQTRFGKADWYHLDPLRHPHHFTPTSLHLLAARAGFAVEELRFNSFYQNFVGDLVTLVNKVLPCKNALINGLRLNPDYLARFGHGRAWFMVLLAGLMSATIAMPVAFFTLFSQLLGRAGTMVAVMKPMPGSAAE